MLSTMANIATEDPNLNFVKLQTETKTQSLGVDFVLPL